MGTLVSVMMWLWRWVGEGEVEGEAVEEEEVEEGGKDESSGDISYSYWWAAKYFGGVEEDVEVDVDPVSMESCLTVMMNESVSQWGSLKFSNLLK